MRKNRRPSKSWIEISKSSLLSNLAEFRKIVGKKRILCVVKANAYGHGMELVANVLKNKTDWFGVDSISEAEKLRKLGIIKPILVLGYIPLRDVQVAVENNISFVVYNRETIDKIVSLKTKKVAKVHIKIETGTNRQGLLPKEALNFAKYIGKQKRKVEIEGIYTHFANIEDTLNSSFAMLQLKRFNETVNLFKNHLKKPKIVHCASSAAAILYPRTHCSMIRLGISLYGLWPSREVEIECSLRKRGSISLKAVMSWKSIVAQVKNIKKGESVSYGRTWFAPKKTKIAVIPVGYSDGFDRKLTNIGRVLIRGKLAPVIGRVAMNIIVVDITEISNVKVEDEVVILGKSGENYISAEELAGKTGTINYEVVSKINPLVPRIVI